MLNSNIILRLHKLACMLLYDKKATRLTFLCVMICDDNVIFLSFREELKTADGTSLPASLPCSGGPDGAHGLLIVDSAGQEVDLQTGDAVVGRRSGRLLAKVSTWVRCSLPLISKQILLWQMERSLAGRGVIGQ